ncbi:putative galacturonosyltransferase 4 [Camellia lanceoleosa]|uniref:Galacturonosyltransferase 4 n=1 Tax=Camellia lanceoleosa TaxID=1840588 RepID=A0ACC0HVC7_9ERIC|nr:putative galacturonosyltransferase 4 [Camellia lanceoleosa]
MVGEVRRLVVEERAIGDLKEPLGMVYLKNSSRLSLSDSNASTGENSRKTRQLTEESAEHLNTVSTTIAPEIVILRRKIQLSRMQPPFTKLQETKLEKQSAKTSVKFGAGEPIKTKIEKQNDKTVMPSDARVRHLKDQLIQGRVYLSLTATRNNPHFIRELRLRMKEAQRSLGEATKDSELPRK